jgi:4'-phosphopantetheinyl transferase
MAPDGSAGTVVWLARGESELPGRSGWLTGDEAARASAMGFRKRRTEFLLRRWVGKHAVAAVAGLPDDDRSLARIEVTNRPGGAPAVLVDGAEAGLEVSLSDRAGWALCVVGTAPRRVGCDLELVEPRSPGFVADYLTDAEQAYVVAQPAAEQDAAATLVWSAKESALKVLGTGLRRDTRSVVVDLGTPAPGWQPLTVRPAEGGAFPGWWCRFGPFVLTMAGERSSPAPVTLEEPSLLQTAQPEHTWVEGPLVAPRH